MATNRDLLKEAIADAKAVKETAIANAKLALEEAFTPHLKSMLAAKLEEMDKEDDVKEEYGKKYEEDDMKKEEMKKYSEDDMKKEEMKKYSEDDMKKEEMKKDDVEEMYGKKYEEDDVKKEEMDSKDKDKKMEEEDKKELEEMDAVSWNEKNNPTRSKSVTLKDPKKVGQSTSDYYINVNENLEEEIDLDELLAELSEEKEMTDAEKKEIDREADAIRDDADQISKLAKDAGEDAADIKKKVDDDRAIDAVRDDMDQISKLAKDAGEDAKDVKVSEEMKSKKDDMDEEMKKDKDDVKEEMKDKDDVKEDARTDAEEEGYLDGMKDEKEDMEDDMRDEDIDLEDMSEDDLKGFIEDVIKDMVSAGEIEPGDDFVEDEMDVETDVEIEIDEEMKSKKDDDVKEEKEEMDERKSRVKGEYGVGNEDGDRDDSKIEKETERMRFKEAIEEIQALKEELKDVNLLNAKLLYTNKIFKAKNLTESKKVKVLKAFDKAKDVRQAKTIFETLSDGLLDKSKSPVNESIKGAASRATGVEPKASKKQPIIESNEVYNRMRQLAGLI